MKTIKSHVLSNKLHKRYKTPYVSLAIFAVIAGLIILWSRGNIAFLADLYTFGAMLAFFMAHISLIMMRIRKPNAERPFRIPVNLRFRNFQLPISAILGGIMTFAVWILVIVTKPEGRYLGMTWIILGIIMYYSYRRRHKMAPTGQLEIQKIKIPEFKASSYKNILVPTRGGQQSATVQMACEIAKLHGAQVTALHVIEVPFSVPLDTPMYHRSVVAESVLKRAEAIGREFKVVMKLKVIHARSIDKAILEMSEEEHFDLIVLGASISKGGATAKGLGAVTEKILRESICPIWINLSTLSPVKKGA